MTKTEKNKKIYFRTYSYMDMVSRYRNDEDNHTVILQNKVESVIKDKDDYYIKEDKEFYNDCKFLMKHMEKYPHEELRDTFHNNTSLDFDFIEKLKLYDVIWSDCFIPDNKLGKILIELVSRCDFKFVLTLKEYRNMNYMEVEFEVCHTDNLYVLFEKLTGVKK